MRTREETGEYNPIAIVKDSCEESKCSIEIEDSGGQRPTCYYMAKDGSFHSSNGWTTDWMNSISVCSHCTGSTSGDVTTSRVLVTDGHSWPPSTDFGDERPPPEPPPIARPPPEPPPMRNST